MTFLDSFMVYGGIFHIIVNMFYPIIEGQTM